MANKLFVGGLPYSVNDDQLRELFVAVGTVQSAQVIVDRYSNQSKGFGFVEMSSDEEAQQAIKQLDGTEMGGRKIVVSEARPQVKRERSFGENRGDAR